MTRRTTQYLTFGLDHHFCAIPAAVVKEICPIAKSDPANDQKRVNAFELRGVVIPLINFRQLLGLNDHEGGSDSRIVVVDCLHGFQGIQVDAVQSVIDLPALSFPDLVPGEQPIYFERVQIQGHMLVLINILHCLNPSFKGVEEAFHSITRPVPAKIRAS